MTHLLLLSIRYHPPGGILFRDTQGEPEVPRHLLDNRLALLWGQVHLALYMNQHGLLEGLYHRVHPSFLLVGYEGD